jgi:ABC-type dipeptide/oligopeptide/nickel transport system ATPase subunit
MSLLRLENVSFAYGRTATLSDVSLTLDPGRSLGLVGESGSGKTTLLRLVLGLERPASGRILFDNQPVEPRNSAFMRTYRRNVQAVFQDPYSSLDPRQKVLRIVSEPLRALKIEGDHAAIVRDALTSVGLDPDILDRLPHEFSGGQRQRIAIARAIVACPRLLLADEAVSALDLSTRIRIIELFKTLATQMTLVFVSHDLGAVAALCDDLVILEKGHLVEAGPTRKILTAPQHPYTRTLLASVPRMPA